ncbi:MAG: hypothetical protein JWM18_3759, partial [Chloroflexi bacterium]|nr:hypothetical protein [Chloroflexota bacterium]
GWADDSLKRPVTANTLFQAVQWVQWVQPVQ